MKREQRRRGLSLRARLTLAFLGILVAGTAITTTFAVRALTSALLGEARARVRHGLEVARTVYAERLSRVGRGVARVADHLTTSGELPRAGAEALGMVLLEQRRTEALDFVGYVDAGSRLAIHSSDGSAAPTPLAALAPLVEASLADRHLSTGTVVLEPGALADERADLLDVARVAPAPAAHAGPGPRDGTAAGLVLAAAAPVFVEGRLAGVAYGGYLLNHDTELVEQVERLVWFDETAPDDHVGVVSISLGDVRIATCIHLGESGRAIGSRASAATARAVLVEGRSLDNRAFVAGGWHVASHEPLRDPTGAIVGMLSVSMPEAPFLARRTHVALTFFVIAVASVLAAMGLIVLITRGALRPLEEMAGATRRISGGDLELAIPVRSSDEIGELASSFNAMVESLKAMRGELQEWGKTLEEKVRQRTEELVAVQAGMAQSEKLASVGRLAAGVAHEINNPLGGILSLSLLRLEETPPDAPERADLELISKLTLRCREIVKGLLEFSRQSPVKLERTDVSLVAQGTVELLDRQALFHRITRTVELGRDLPAVLIDPGQLQQVVTNMLLNAVDAMEDGGELAVTTGLDEASGEVFLRIADSGPGIPDDVLPLIFEPFFTTKTVGKGTGLGLAIVHGIVARAGGRVTVDTSPRGTTFTVHLPAAAAVGHAGSDT